MSRYWHWCLETYIWKPVNVIKIRIASRNCTKIYDKIRLNKQKIWYSIGYCCSNKIWSLIRPRFVAKDRSISVCETKVLSKDFFQRTFSQFIIFLNVFVRPTLIGLRLGFLQSLSTWLNEVHMCLFINVPTLGVVQIIRHTFWELFCPSPCEILFLKIPVL